MAALVANSYKNLEQVSDVYNIDGKQYVKVRMNNGTIKAVKAYTEKEYSRYLATSNSPVKVIKPAASRDKVLGFGDEHLIYIVKGNTFDNIDWLKWSACRYNRMFGWYLPSTEPMPTAIPDGLEFIPMNWDAVVDENGELRPEDEVTNIVDEYRYDPSPSQYYGEIGDKIDMILVCDNRYQFENNYGLSTLHTFHDPETGNVFTWTTNARVLDAGTTYHITGKIKGYQTYHNVKQTILTRCQVKG